MKVTVDRPVELNIDMIRLDLPVKYDEEDMPSDFPFRYGDSWKVDIDIDTGRIRNWPAGVKHDLYMKVTDGGCYSLFSGDEEVACIVEDYVPHGLIPGEYGDYVALNIEADGTITNWPDEPDLNEFFGRDDD